MITVNKKSTITINFSYKEIEKLVIKKIQEEAGSDSEIQIVDFNWDDKNRKFVAKIEESENLINLINQKRLEKFKVISFIHSDKLKDLFTKIKDNINLQTGEKMILSRLSNAMGSECTIEELLNKTPEEIRKTGIHVYRKISHRFLVDVFILLGVQLTSFPFMKYE